MLATLVSKPFNRSGCINEEKYDGFRALAYRRGNGVRLYSRNLKDITAEFPGIVRALVQLSGGDFLMDGEIVAFERKGVSRFQLLQRRELDLNVRPIFALFDCLERDGEEILKRPPQRPQEGTGNNCTIATSVAHAFPSSLLQRSFCLQGGEKKGMGRDYCEKQFVPLQTWETNKDLAEGKINLLTFERRLRGKDPWTDFRKHPQLLPSIK